MEKMTIQDYFKIVADIFTEGDSISYSGGIIRHSNCGIELSEFNPTTNEVIYF